MAQTETKKFGEFGAWNNSVIFFRNDNKPSRKCRKDWSLKNFGKMGALDSERWEYPPSSLLKYQLTLLVQSEESNRKNLAHKQQTPG